MTSGFQKPDEYDASARAGTLKNYKNTSKKGTPPMGKEKTDKDREILNKGSSNHMSGQNHAGPQEPGQSAAGGLKVKTKDNLSVGRGHMFPKMHAGEQTPGQSAAGGAFKGSKWGVEGGKGANNHMHPYRPSIPAKPA
jgi:hypothetical protein